MQPVLGLIEHGALRTIHHVIRYLLAAVGWQAVHGYGALAGMVTFAVYGALLTIYSYGGRAGATVSGATLGQQIVIELISIVLYLCISALIGWLGGRPGSSQGRARAARLAQEQTPLQ